MNKILEPIRRRIKLMLTKAVVSMVDADSLLQSLQVKAVGGEELEVEHLETYGLTSHPHPGAEVLLGSLCGRRDHTVALCVVDRRYRVTGLLTGEVAIHDDLGQSIILHRDRIEITAPQGLEIIGDVNVTGDVIANGISLVNHTHGGVEPGAGNTGAPQ